VPERSNGAVSKFDYARAVRSILVSKEAVFKHLWTGLAPALVRLVPSHIGAFGSKVGFASSRTVGLSILGISWRLGS
jgi:hypothetical protein